MYIQVHHWVHIDQASMMCLLYKKRFNYILLFSVEVLFSCKNFDLCKYLAQDYFIAVKIKLKIFPYNQLCISMH